MGQENSEVNNLLLSLAPCPAARSSTCKLAGICFASPSRPGTPACSSANAGRTAARARRRAAGPTVAVANRFGRDAASEPILPRSAAAVPGSIWLRS